MICWTIKTTLPIFLWEHQGEHCQKGFKFISGENLIENVVVSMGKIKNYIDNNKHTKKKKNVSKTI